MALSIVECNRMGSGGADRLGEFFKQLGDSPESDFFRPHPMTDEEATRRVAYAGRDFFCVVLDEVHVLAYGMLRGWDEGYAIPSLGIAVHPTARGLGIGTCLMHFLHAEARRREARHVRLTVSPHNGIAVRMYAQLGYVLRAQPDGRLLGMLNLSGRIESPLTRNG